MFRISRLLRTTPAMGLAASLLLLSFGAVEAQIHEVNTSSGLTIKGAPLALRGLDPVSYFKDGGPVAGKADIATNHAGATYRFANKKNLKRFEADPQQYTPRYGGFCAYGVSVGAKFDGDPLVWKIVDGKLYLNLNSEIQKAWNADVKGAIQKAETNWPKIRSSAPDRLKPQS